MPRPRLLPLLAFPLLAAACAGDNPYLGALDVAGPVATRDALVWVDRDRAEALFVAPGDPDLDIRRVALGDPEDIAVAWTAATLDGGALLALLVPASAKKEDIDEQLLRLPADGAGDPVAYDVRAPFDALALSPDRRRAILYFRDGGDSEPLHNANQVAILDLQGTRVQNVTLNGFGGALKAVEFPGQARAGEPGDIDVGGVRRDIAAFLAPSEVVLLDLDDPELDQVAVPLGPDIGFAPVRTLLRPGDPLFAAPALFVLSAAGGEVGMLTLLPEPGGPGFTAQISLIPVGASATDLALHNSAAAPYLITVDAFAAALVFTDIRTQGGFTVELGAPAAQVYLRDTFAGDGGLARQAVAWAPGGGMISTLDLDGIEESLGRKPRYLKVEAGINQLVRLDNDRALIGAGNRLYIVDFPAEQVTPLSARTPYDPRDSALLGDRLLLGSSGQGWVSTVDLRTQSPESMLLDESIAGFYYLPGPDRLVVTHTAEGGLLTVIDPAKPARSTSRVHWGFLLGGALDRE